MKLRPTTKMAYQAAIAIAIAEMIVWYFQLERGYWVTLTAMALTMQTWGESLKRSFERVIMTIIGGACGTVLYFILPDNHTIVFIALLFCVFLNVYLIQIIYQASVFFLTCFVVFLFAILGEWTLSILVSRIMDTIIGAVIALGVGACFFRLKSDVADLFVSYWEKIRASLCFNVETINLAHLARTGHHLAKESQQIRRSAIAQRYELFFNRMSQRHFYSLLNDTTMCTQYAINIIDTASWLLPHLNQVELDAVRQVMETTCFNIDMLINQLRHNDFSALLPVMRASDLLDKSMAEDPTRFGSLDNEILGFFNLMYFFARFNLCLAKVKVTLSQL